jgi:hypothetical protein
VIATKNKKKKSDSSHVCSSKIFRDSSLRSIISKGEKQRRKKTHGKDGQSLQTQIKLLTFRYPVSPHNNFEIYNE